MARRKAPRAPRNLRRSLIRTLSPAERRGMEKRQLAAARQWKKRQLRLGKLMKALDKALVRIKDPVVRNATRRFAKVVRAVYLPKRAR